MRQTLKSARGTTATMTIAAKEACGMYRKLSDAASIATITIIPANTPLSKVWAPALLLIGVRQKLPVTGYA